MPRPYETYKIEVVYVFRSLVLWFDRPKKSRALVVPPTKGERVVRPDTLAIRVSTRNRGGSEEDGSGTSRVYGQLGVKTVG